MGVQVDRELKKELDADKPEGEEALNSLFKQIYGNVRFHKSPRRLCFVTYAHSMSLITVKMARQFVAKWQNGFSFMRNTPRSKRPR